MASKKVNVKIAADVNEAKNGINKITEQLNTMTKNANKSNFKKGVSPSEN